MKKGDSLGSEQGGERDGRKTSCTAAQRRVRKNVGWLSRLWNELTEEQRTAWRRMAWNIRSRVRKACSYPLDGQKVFNKVNWVLALLGREARRDPPPVPRFGPNPVRALEITGTGRGMSLKLRVSRAPANEIMVYGSPPQNAGRGYCGDSRFLGLLPAVVEDASEITRLYVEKYGVPRENSKIFIRTWPEENGWEDRGQMLIASALVPRRGGGAAG